MKAFKEWLKEENQNLINIAADLERSDVPKVIAEVTCRATLKWVLEEIKICGRFDDEEYNEIIDELQERIKNELES